MENLRRFLKRNKSASAKIHQSSEESQRPQTASPVETPKLPPVSGRRHSRSPTAGVAEKTLHQQRRTSSIAASSERRADRNNSSASASDTLPVDTDRRCSESTDAIHLRLKQKLDQLDEQPVLVVQQPSPAADSSHHASLPSTAAVSRRLPSRYVYVRLTIWSVASGDPSN